MSNRISATWFAGALTALVSAFILFHLHDHGWFAPDDGFYADIAERVLHGDILHKDIRSIFPGYTHYLNASALSIFGSSLSGIRLPLVALSLLFSVAIAVGIGGYRGSIAGIASVCCGPVVFMNPSSSWYALYAACTLALLAYRARRWNQRSVLLLAGIVVGSCFMFRQLSGATLAVGLLLALSTMDDSTGNGRKRHLSIASILAGAGINFYLLVFQEDLTSWLLFGAAPSYIAASQLWTSQDYRKQCRVVSLVFLGATASAAPLLLINVWNESLLQFITDITVSAFAIPRLDFIHQSSYDLLLTDSISGIFDGVFAMEPLEILVSLCVACLVLAPLALCLRIIAIRWGSLEDREKRAIAIITGFAASSAHFPSLIYLIYTAPMVLFGHVILNGKPTEEREDETPHWRDLIVLAISASSLLGLAGRPITGSSADIFFGKSVPLSHVTWIPRLDLFIPVPEAREVTNLVTRINQSIAPGATIFVFPANAELYFLTNGKNEASYYYAGFGIPDCSSLFELAQNLSSKSGPHLIVHAIHEKYETPMTQALTDWLDLTFDVAWEAYGATAYRRPKDEQPAIPVCPSDS